MQEDTLWLLDGFERLSGEVAPASSLGAGSALDAAADAHADAQRLDALSDRFIVRHTGLEPQPSRRGPTHRLVCYSHV